MLIASRLVSRKGKKFRQFDPLLKQVLRSLKGQRAILDGEIVVLDEKGRSNFYDLMTRRGEPRYYAFDLVWLNGQDLRCKPKTSPYPFTWIKVKNPNYSQAVGRREWFVCLLSKPGVSTNE